MASTERKKLLIVVTASLFISVFLFPFSALATIVSGSSTAVSFGNTPVGVKSIKVAAPGGVVIISEELTVHPKEFFPDGDYQYELTGELPLTEKPSKTTTALDNGRTNASPTMQPVGVIDSGDFRIINGTVFDARARQETN